jgi:hypothetical protein
MTEPSSPHHESPPFPGYTRLRQAHLIASGAVGVIALTHSALTFVFYREWGSEAVWFLGTGLGLMVVSALNLSHIGIEPCHSPTAKLVRWANWLFALFEIAAVVAIPEPQAFLMLGALGVQAVVAHWTLPGPERHPTG